MGQTQYRLLYSYEVNSVTMREDFLAIIY